MVESISPHDAADHDLEERYRAVEEAYAAQHWSHVIRLGESLLGSLKGNKGLAFELRPRTQVLIAHSYLYGLSDRDAAEDLYSAVISSRCDPTLRQIAAEGLQACNQPLPGRPQVQGAAALGQGEQLEPQAATAVAPAEAAAATTLAPEHITPAMPWLTQEEQASPPGESASAGVAASDAPWLSSPAPGPGPAATMPAATMGEPDAAVAAPPQGAGAQPAETLIPEVIDEPELIEVHQANPALADQVDLTITAPTPRLSPGAASGPSQAVDRLVASTVVDPRPLDAALVQEAIQELERQNPDLSGKDQAWPDPLDLDSLPSLGSPIDDPDADLAGGLLRVVIR